MLLRETKNKNGEIIVCCTWFRKLRGMYFRHFNNVCIIYPCNCIHTFFFFRKLDVAFLSKDLVVIKIIRNLNPWSIRYCKGSFYVIEQFAHPNEGFYELGEVVS